ncbi:MAG: hypothetical protein AUK51_06675 [Comamonadaceae bacterium CG2_30_59_20]|nr:MAG: hypothetical protein AUK51_06675 [Comamonadaceae bacterium CG2_30_59_20]
MNKSPEKLNDPWWKHGFVWMIIAGPAIVVVAGFITLYLAISRPNEIVDETTYQQGRQSDMSIEARRMESGQAPAMLGRNHATTGVVPPPSED